MIWLLVIGAVVLIAGWYALPLFEEAFGAKCSIHRKWEIEGYVIVEKRCIGWAGPPYFPVSLYEQGKEVDQAIMSDPCRFRFATDRGDSLKFNICDMSMERIEGNTSR